MTSSWSCVPPDCAMSMSTAFSSGPPTSASWCSGPHEPPISLDDLELGVVPEVLGLDEQAVHVEQDGGGQQASTCWAGAHVALKYLASGWCTISAEVDCSGCSWNSSDSSTPMRDGSSRSTSTACISTSGQAG